MKRTPLGAGARSLERGSTFAKPRSELRRSTLLQRTSAPKRKRPIGEASPAQRAKVRDQACVACGRTGSELVAIDPAHLYDRSLGGCDDALCVVPLCRTSRGGCHRDYDEGRLDLLRVLADVWPAWWPEVSHAMCHGTPVQVLERIANARVRWS